MKTSTAKRTHRALTLIETLVVIAIIVILVLLVSPMSPRPDRSRTAHCLYNLKQIDISMLLFAEDNNGRFPTSPANLYDTNRLISSFQAISNELNNPAILVCPEDTRKAAKNLHSLKTENISYFLSLDAKPELTNAIIAGDRNLAVSGQPVKPGLFSLTPDLEISWTRDMHSKIPGIPSGNVALADGHVEGLRKTNFAALVRRQNMPTNRLIVP